MESEKNHKCEDCGKLIKRLSFYCKVEPSFADDSWKYYCEECSRTTYNYEPNFIFNNIGVKFSFRDHNNKKKTLSKHYEIEITETEMRFTAILLLDRLKYKRFKAWYDKSELPLITEDNFHEIKVISKSLNLQPSILKITFKLRNIASGGFAYQYGWKDSTNLFLAVASANGNISLELHKKKFNPHTPAADLIRIHRIVKKLGITAHPLRNLIIEPKEVEEETPIITDKEENENQGFCPNCNSVLSSHSLLLLNKGYNAICSNCQKVVRSDELENVKEPSTKKREKSNIEQDIETSIKELEAIKKQTYALGTISQVGLTQDITVIKNQDEKWVKICCLSYPAPKLASFNQEEIQRDLNKLSENRTVVPFAVFRNADENCIWYQFNDVEIVDKFYEMQKKLYAAPPVVRIVKSMQEFITHVKLILKYNGNIDQMIKTIEEERIEKEITEDLPVLLQLKHKLKENPKKIEEIEKIVRDWWASKELPKVGAE